MSKINVGQWRLEESSVINSQHDSVVISCSIKNGINTLPAGTLLAIEESTGELTPANTGDAVFGVLTGDFDSSEGIYANILIHGAVNKRTLENVKGQKLSVQEMICLIRSGIYPL